MLRLNRNTSGQYSYIGLQSCASCSGPPMFFPEYQPQISLAIEGLSCLLGYSLNRSQGNLGEVLAVKLFFLD